MRLEDSPATGIELYYSKGTKIEWRSSFSMTDTGQASNNFKYFTYQGQ